MLESDAEDDEPAAPVAVFSPPADAYVSSSSSSSSSATLVEEGPSPLPDFVPAPDNFFEFVIAQNEVATASHQA